MVSIPSHKSKPPRKREQKGNWVNEEHEVLGGRVKVFRTNQSGNVYQMRVWIHENQRYYRKSLRTECLEEALHSAEELYLDIRANMKTGKPVFEYSTKELVEKYLEHKSKDIGDITKERVVTIRSQMKWYLLFVSDNIKIGAIPPTKFEEYHNFRRGQAPTVRTLTLINEASTIKNFYKFCIDRNYVDISKFPKFPRVIKRRAEKDEKVSRDELTFEEWKKIYTHMWTWSKDCVDCKVKEQMEFVRDFAILLANTGLRFGEARKLRWEDIRILPSGKDGVLPDVRISVKEGKTGARITIGRRGDIFHRLKNLSKYTKPTDFIFVNNENGEQIKREVYYEHWNKMITDLKLDNTTKQIVFYSLRHSYATWRLYSGVDVFTLAKNMGTSVAFIEQHYGHVEVDKKRYELTQDMDKEIYKIVAGEEVV